MPFLPPNQQRQSTEGENKSYYNIVLIPSNCKTFVIEINFHGKKSDLNKKKSDLNKKIGFF